MEKDYLTEAFKALEELNEDAFDISTVDGFEKAKEFEEEPVWDDREDQIIIDPLAETEEELEKDYVGKAILQCEICQSMIYKNPDEVIIDEEAGLANIGEACPFCQSQDGFKVIGEIKEFCDNEECEKHPEDCDCEECKEKQDVELEAEDNIDEAIKTRRKVRIENLKEAQSLKAKMARKAQKDPLDDIDADADDKKEIAKKEFEKSIDDADSDRDYKLKRKGLKESDNVYDVRTKQGHKFLVKAKDENSAKDWTNKNYRKTVKGDFDIDEVTKTNKTNISESDKPAATSIEDAQKWVDFDMKRYGKISERTNRLVKKAGFQIIKDDHGDYEVAAGKFEDYNELRVKGPRGTFRVVEKSADELRKDGFGYHHTFEADGNTYDVFTKDDRAVAILKEYFEINGRPKEEISKAKKVAAGKFESCNESLKEATATSKVIYRISDYTDNEQLSTISKDEVLKYLNAKLDHNISVYQNEVRLVKPHIDVINFWFEDYNGVYGYSENYYKFPNIDNHFETKKLTESDIESIERILIESTATPEELNALMINFSSVDIVDSDNEMFKLDLSEKSELKHFLVYRHNYCIVIAPNAELALEAINDHYSHEIRKDHVPYKLVKDAKSLKKYLGESLKEDFNKVDIETDKEKMSMTADKNGKVTVTTEPKVEEAEIKETEEVIAPVSDEVKSKFKSSEDAAEEEPEEIDYDFDEFEEKDFDSLGEGFLKRVYENVKSFKTTSGKVNGNEIMLEGLITFKSGKQAKTNFIFEAYKATKTGKLKFIGENKQFAKGKKSFTLSGKADGKKLVCESLTYNYCAKAQDGTSKRLYGTIRR